MLLAGIYASGVGVNLIDGEVLYTPVSDKLTPTPIC